MLRPQDFFNLNSLDSMLQGIFEDVKYVWEVLNEIGNYIEYLLRWQKRIHGRIPKNVVLTKTNTIYIGEGVIIEPGVYISGPAYIGAGCVIRQGAYIRGNVIAGEGCLLGHGSEFKNAILLPGSKAPHFAYVGDSILGRGVNLGAGTKLSNLTVTSSKDNLGRRPTIKLTIPEISDTPIDTGLSKFGAILGDNVQTGCNVVTNPGCLIGPNTLIYPGAVLRKGYWPGNSIIKMRQTIEVVQRKFY